MVNSLKEKCKSKQENIVKEDDTTKEVIISRPSAVEVKTDNTEQHANLQCDVCEYTCNKKNTMEKHMNIKHNSNHIAKEWNMKDTSEKVKDQQEQTETNEKRQEKKQTKC